VDDVEKAGPSKAGLQSERQHKTLLGLNITTPASHAGTDAVFAAKAQLLNQALLDIGMGKYQWLIFLMTGVGWFLDSVGCFRDLLYALQHSTNGKTLQFWITSFIIIAPSSGNEAQFFFTGNNTNYLFVSLFVGLTVGGTVWPLMSDTLGRKQIFTSTIVLMGMGGLVGAGMPSFTGLCVVGAVVSFAVAGNQSVDAMTLVESLPASHQFLIALQGAFWGLGRLFASAVGW
jgi:MFS family permease